MWGCWTAWSECSAGNEMPCGDDATRTRTRECDCPEGTSIEDCPCLGEPEEVENCELPPCEDCKLILVYDS